MRSVVVILIAILIVGAATYLFIARRSNEIAEKPLPPQEIVPFTVDLTTGDASAGAKVFNDACAQCHGPTGLGGVGKRLIDNQFLATNSDAQFISLLLTGREGTAMRAFRNQLTEKQLADVIAYVRNLKLAADGRR